MNSTGRLTPEFKTWRRFIGPLLHPLLPNAEPLWIVPEIGPANPHGYNLSVFPPAWDQARRCLRELRRLVRTPGN
jgi:hypothetical protein